MSTRQDLQNQRFFLRRINKNKNTLSISIPQSIIKKQNIKPQDYLSCFWEDSTNRLVFKKLDIKIDGVTDVENDE
jgi:hypothetical protein